MPFYVPPEQLVKDRAEYARKGIARGRSILGLEYADGALLLAENPSRTLHKISEIYDRVAFAGVGKYNEFETLRKAGIRHADVMGYMYSRDDVSAKALANAFSQTLGAIFTHEMKPYEVEVLIVEVGLGPDSTGFYRISYDGTLQDERDHCAIGGKSDELAAAMREAGNGTRTLAEALGAAAQAFARVEEREIEGWEAAVLDRTLGRRTFRRLTEDDIQELLGEGR